MKVEFSRVSCRVRGHWTSEGSVFAGTISSVCHRIEIEFDIESGDDPARLAALIQNAKGGCYAEAMVREPVPVASAIRLNGQDFDYESYPREVERRR